MIMASRVADSCTFLLTADWAQGSYTEVHNFLSSSRGLHDRKCVYFWCSAETKLIVYVFFLNKIVIKVIKYKFGTNIMLKINLLQESRHSLFTIM